ncbi:hypothetical protein BD779DRAFT_1472084 [Infundibulicybe gibba]|nr:hypothetical protein BD779DRAFT_1472084 [Infundibulicybe gibba]
MSPQSITDQNVIEAEADMKGARTDEGMLPLINQTLANHKMKTFDEFKAGLMAAMTPEQMQASETVCLPGGPTVTVFSLLARTSLIVVLRNNNILPSHDNNIHDALAGCFVTLITEGFLAGKAAFQAVVWSPSITLTCDQANRWTLPAWESLLQKPVKFSIVAIIDTIVDVFILAFAMTSLGPGLLEPSIHKWDLLNPLAWAKSPSSTYYRQADHHPRILMRLAPCSAFGLPSGSMSITIGSSRQSLVFVSLNRSGPLASSSAPGRIINLPPIGKYQRNRNDWDDRDLRGQTSPATPQLKVVFVNNIVILTTRRDPKAQKATRVDIDLNFLDLEHWEW